MYVQRENTSSLSVFLSLSHFVSIFLVFSGFLIKVLSFDHIGRQVKMAQHVKLNFTTSFLCITHLSSNFEWTCIHRSLTHSVADQPQMKAECTAAKMQKKMGINPTEF